MRIGVSLTSAHAVTDPRLGVRWMIERARAARDAGLDSLFVGDHHATRVPYYQNVPILGRLLAEWDDRPAGCLFLLPLWHPVLVAEQVGTLAAIAKGRFIMQCAVGGGMYDPEQFDAFGVDPRQRPSRFEQALDIVRRLLRGETVTSEGRYRVRNARIAPVPTEPVEVWIGGSAPPAIDRAARLGDGWLAAPDLTPEQARQQLELYRERCAAHGRTPSAIAIRRDIYVGADPEEAKAVAEPILARGYRGFDPRACVYGSAEQVAEQFLALREMGYTDVIVRHLTNEQPKVLASYERLARVREMVAGA
ncbi:Alkanesulfonate monooxygenase [bacterium HR29]|jgi:alkanesulfonate monooxygenase SsuD/methylene tetrahydromethanopterin reductase-like flavin-dependent oxidoreductase (luciferase family)|nr:Alkanesulfonate monooxygenase [bacterium HR29]